MGLNPQAAEGAYRTPAIQHIRPHHRAIARMIAIGVPPKEAGQAFNMTPGHMSHILASPAFQAIVKRLEDYDDEEAIDLRKQMEAMKCRALEILDGDLEVEAETLPEKKFRHKAAVDVLDFTLGRKDNKPPEAGNHLHFHDHKELHQHIKQQSTEDLAQNVLDMVVEKEMNP